MFAQLLFNINLKTNKYKILNKVVLILKKIRLTLGDPAVKYTYLGFKFLFPLSHDLPFHSLNFPTYNKNLALIGKYVSEKYKDSSIIDVGANIGDSVANLRQESRLPILAVEGNKKFLSFLIENIKQFRETVIAPFFVDEKKGKATLVNYNDSAYILSSNGGESVVTMNFLLEEYPLFKKTKLLKIDTDGFDTKIIRSSVDLLDSQHPAIFFEYDPYFLLKQAEDGIEIFSFLINHGYESIILFDNIGRLVCSLSLSNDLHTIKYLDAYFNQKSERFLDICVLTLEDDDIAKKIIDYYLGSN
jgi:FkbM family methyltransferase